MKKFIFVFYLVCFGIKLFAQITVTGNVKETKTEVAIHDALVVIMGKRTGTYTDTRGNFELIVNQQPPFTIKISMIGFIDNYIEIVQNNQVVNITLDENETELNEIVISASRRQERILESPVTIERIDIIDIKNNSSSSFYDGLENLKGVDINTNSLTFKSVNTRGFATFANNRFVQLIDGMDNTSPALNFVLGNMLGMSELDVRTVELLPGASSALYGANAFNGIMFMESKNPFEFKGVSFYGKTGYTVQKAAGTNPFVDAGFRIAHVFSNKLAAKASVSFLKGTEWYATDYNDYNNPGFDRNNPAYDGLNVYGDEVSTLLNFEKIALASNVPAQYAAMMGSQTVSRTGYKESDLIDYNAKTIKSDLSLNYRPKGDDLEFILNAKYGTGTTIYQGANRYSIRDFTLTQYKFEVRNNNFFIRLYTTGEDAGKSYDTRFAAINTNRTWKSDTQWFTEYTGTYIQTFMANILAGKTPVPAEIHQSARNAAQTGALVPGTPQFSQVFQKVISDPNFATGAKFMDNSRTYHMDINYNFSQLIKFAEIQAGGSWRQYSLNSKGTIFTDYDGAITYNEFGAYVQAQKKVFDDRLKFTGSFRYDKAQQFDGFVSPRISFTYSAGREKNHNFRVSYQTGFRNPTTQDLYIGLDAGRAFLVGAAPDNLDRYTTPSLNVSPTGRSLGFPATVAISGRNAYDNSFSLSSVLSGSPKKSAFDLVKPEKINAYEIGYRGIYSIISIDLNGYINQYNDFIGNKTVLVPYYGKTDLSDIHPVANVPNALIAMQYGDYKPFQVYTNSAARISSGGIGLGITTKIHRRYLLGFNYTWSKFNFDKSSDPDYKASFNTPEHNFKASLGNQNLFKNFGFNINYRWHNEYFWESSFVDGFIPANSVFDAQVNYLISKWKSVLKIGGTNIKGNEYFSAPGTGHIGSQYYVSWTTHF